MIKGEPAGTPELDNARVIAEAGGPRRQLQVIRSSEPKSPACTRTHQIPAEKAQVFLAACGQ